MSDAFELAEFARREERIGEFDIGSAAPLREVVESGRFFPAASGGSPCRQQLRAALIALDQMDAADLKAQEVIPFLNSTDERLRAAANWIVGRKGVYEFSEVFDEIIKA